MRQRTTGIAALLILLLALPLSCACATVAHAAQSHHAYCAHQAMPDACGGSTARLCCAARIPVDSATFPIQSVAPLVLPTRSTAVFAYGRLLFVKPVGLAHAVPVQHAPPGLLIAQTVVLRI